MHARTSSSKKLTHGAAKCRVVYSPFRLEEDLLGLRTSPVNRSSDHSAATAGGGLEPTRGRPGVAVDSKRQLKAWSILLQTPPPADRIPHCHLRAWVRQVGLLQPRMCKTYTMHHRFRLLPCCCSLTGLEEEQWNECVSGSICPKCRSVHKDERCNNTLLSSGTTDTLRVWHLS